jgi:hypothetical protein
MTTERDLKAEYNERYQEAYREWDAFLTEAKRDLKFYHADQWSDQEKQYLQWNRREALAWNKIRRVVKLITGYQRKNRLGFRVDPLENSDSKAASQYTGLLLHAMNLCSGFHVMSDAFEQTLKTGIHLVEVTVDHSEDPVSGDIKLVNVPFTRFLFDPNLSKRDLSDCNYLLRREWVSKSEAQMLLPSKAKEIERMKPVQSDLKFDYSRKAQGSEERLRWDEYWRRDSEKRTILIDTQSGAWRLWPKNADKERLDLLRQEMGDRITAQEIYRPTVKLAILLENEVMYDGPDPLEIGDYPFVPIWGDWSPEHDKFGEKLSGIIRDIRDPQKELNKRRSKILDIMDSQINSGWYAETGSVVNEKDLYQAGQGKVIWTNPGALAKGQLQPIQPAQIPQGFFQMQEILDQDIKEIPGANNELFGVADEKEQQMPGMLAKLRQSQGLTTLQDWFDNYRFSKGILGNKLVKVMQQSFTPDKVSKVLGEQPAKEFFDRDFGKYSVTAVEAPLTDTQKQMAYQERIALKQQGAPIPWAAIMEVAPLQLREDLQETIQQQEQQAAQQMQIQQRMEQIRMQAELAKMREDTAQAVENRTQAEENRAGAVLDRTKAMAEIDKMDAEKLQTLAQVVQSLQGPQQSQMQSEQGQQGQKRQRAMTKR